MKRAGSVAMLVAAGTFLLAYAIGTLLGKTRQATYRLPLKETPLQVWNALNGKIPRNERALASTDRQLWTEERRLGNRRWRVIEKKEPVSLVLTTVESELFDRITRVIEIVSREGGGTELRVTERTTILHPLYRLYARLTHSRERELAAYLTEISETVAAR